MGRVKVVMEPINDIKKRNITFQRRKEGIIKKAAELSTLCDVNVSMIIFNDNHQTPQIFPPDTDKFNTLINLYQKNGSKTDPAKIRSHDHLSRKNKIEKEKQINLEGKYPKWFEFLNDFPEWTLREFAYMLEDKVKKVKTRIEFLKKTSQVQNLESHPPSAVIVVDDDDNDENRSPMIKSMMVPNMDYEKFGFLPVELHNGDQNPNFGTNMAAMCEEEDKCCDPMMMMDYENLGFDFGTNMAAMCEEDNKCCDPMMMMDYENLGFDFGELCDDQVFNHDLIISQSSNCKYMLGDDDNYIRFEDGFPPEIRQPAEPMILDQFLMSRLPSHVMEYMIAGL